MEPVRVLLIDDNKTFLRLANAYLYEEHHDEVSVVGVARNGRKGLAKARFLKPHIVLLDLKMPDLPGLEVIPLFRQEMPQVGIIVLTLMSANGYREAAIAAGADAFVSKVDLSTHLLAAVRKVAYTYVK